MSNDGAPPRLTADTLQSRAARSGQLWEARQRAREQTAEQFDTVDDRREIPIRRREDGLGPSAGFLDWARPQEAAADLDPEFPRQDLGPGDVRETDSGTFRPTEPVRRRSAAFEFEEQTPLEDVDPFADVVAREGGQGFGLAPQAEREAAAIRFDEQYGDVDLGPSDVTREGDTFGLTDPAEREVAAERLEEQTPLGDVGPGDVRRTEGGEFELRDSVVESNRGLFF